MSMFAKVPDEYEDDPVRDTKSGYSKLDRLKQLLRDLNGAAETIRRGEQRLLDEYGFADVVEANRHVGVIEGQIAALKEWTDPR